MATYTQITDRPTQDKLYRRYRPEIDSLKQLGFWHLAYCLEDHGDFSALKHSLAALFAMSRNEVLRVTWPLRLTVANVLMAAESPPAIALCMGMGIKFYTPFYDGTILITSDFPTSFVPRIGSRIIRLSGQGTLADTWEQHKAEAQKMSEEIKFLEDRMTFGDYVLVSAFEEDAAGFF